MDNYKIMDIKKNNVGAPAKGELRKERVPLFIEGVKLAHFGSINELREVCYSAIDNYVTTKMGNKIHKVGKASGK